MSAVTPIVLTDAQATPVNHTFIPLGPDSSGVWHFEDQTGGVSSGFQRISISLKRAAPISPGKSSASQINRVRLSVSCPRLETMSNSAGGFTPAPVVAYIEKGSVELLLPDRSTSQDRKDLRKYLVGLLGNTHVISAVEDLQSIY